MLWVLRGAAWCCVGLRGCCVLRECRVDVVCCVNVAWAMHVMRE